MIIISYSDTIGPWVPDTGLASAPHGWQSAPPERDIRTKVGGEECKWIKPYGWISVDPRRYGGQKVVSV